MKLIIFYFDLEYIYTLKKVWFIHHIEDYDFLQPIGQQNVI